MTPLPVTLVSGYLGAGKTTLINHLLRHAGGRRLMVMVNDFGELPIDADLIESSEKNKITLANGCICCSIGADLAGAFIDLLNMNPMPDQVLIEASGVAEPHRIANIARAEPDLVLGAIVVLADATSVHRHAQDKLIAAAIHAQLAAADLLLLNKTDLVTAEGLAETQGWIEQTYPDLRYIACERARIDLELLDVQPGPAPDLPVPHSHEDQYTRWSFTANRPFARAKLEHALSTLPGSVLRLKGIVALTDEDGVWAVQCVGARWSLTAHQGEAQNRLVAIGLKDKLAVKDLDALFKT